MKRPGRFTVRLAFMLGCVWMSVNALAHDVMRVQDLIIGTVLFMLYFAWVMWEEAKEDQ